MSQMQQVIEDIKTLKVQGATNVAKACLDGIHVFSDSYEGSNTDEFINEIKVIAWKLASARPTEPLARNLVRFVLSYLSPDQSIQQIQEVVLEDAIMTAHQMLAEAKKQIVQNGVDLITDVDALLTHCHSSTAENIIIGVNKRIPNLKVYATETRPRMQGRITAANLLNAGVDVTVVVDSASSMFITSKEDPDVDAVIIGCDEITPEGGAINKIGSLNVALACQYDGDPLYVATTLLKLDTFIKSETPRIEYRSAKEIWEQAPAGLRIINPAFELVPPPLITGFITEAGVIVPTEVEKVAKETYEWMRTE